MLKGLKYKYILCELQFYKDLGNVFWKCYVYRIFKPLYFGTFHLYITLSFTVVYTLGANQAFTYLHGHLVFL